MNKNKKQVTLKAIKRYSSVKEMKEDIYKWHREHFILSKYYAIRRFFIKIKDFFIYDIKYFIQRARRGYSEKDTWNFDFYLAKIIYEGLEYLKKNKRGYPITILPKNVKDPNKDVDYKANEKVWDEIMDKMIYAFKLAKEVGEGEREFYLPKMSKQFKKEFKCLKREEDRAMKKGFKLFTKHFFNLWD